MTGFSFQAYLWLKILKLITVTEAAHKCKVFDSWHICRTYLVFVAVCTWHPTNIGHQHKLLFYQSLYGNVFTFLVLSPGGTLIFYNLQVTTWSMTVDETYPKTFFSDFLFHKKVTNKTESFVFLNVVFLTNYYREIFNEEILCSQNYLLLPLFARYCHKFSLGLNCRQTMQTLNKCFWFSWEERIKFTYYCLDNCHVWKFHLRSLICYSRLSPTGKCEPLSMSKDFRSVLSEIHQSIHNSINGITFDFFCRGVKRFQMYILDSHKTFKNSMHDLSA